MRKLPLEKTISRLLRGDYGYDDAFDHNVVMLVAQHGKAAVRNAVNARLKKYWAQYEKMLQGKAEEPFDGDLEMLLTMSRVAEFKAWLPNTKAGRSWRSFTYQGKPEKVVVDTWPDSINGYKKTKKARDKIGFTDVYYRKGKHSFVVHETSDGFEVFEKGGVFKDWTDAGGPRTIKQAIVMLRKYTKRGPFV